MFKNVTRRFKWVILIRHEFAGLWRCEVALALQVPAQDNRWGFILFFRPRRQTCNRTEM